MNKYIINVDENNNIIKTASTFDVKKDDIQVTIGEYQQASKYKKYNPKTHIFSEPRIDYSLEDYKAKKVKESKEQLSQWLEKHPLLSEIHNKNGEYYTVTQEKQTQLTQMLMIYSIAAQTGMKMQLTWNRAGGVCEEWTYEELSTLSFQIADYVLPRIKKQQQLEIKINECNTPEEVEGIEIEYDTI